MNQLVRLAFHKIREHGGKLYCERDQHFPPKQARIRNAQRSELNVAVPYDTGLHESDRRVVVRLASSDVERSSLQA